MYRSRVFCGSGCEPALGLHKLPQNFEFQRPERVFSAFLSLRIRGKMVQFLCFEVVFWVVLKLIHHLFLINNLKILNSNVLKKVVIFCVFAG
jgi:hypothetical protein